MERYLRVNMLGPGPRLMKKIYRAAVSQRLRNSDIQRKIGSRYYAIVSAALRDCISN